MTDYYILRDDGNNIKIDDTKYIDDPKVLKALDHKLRRQILRLMLGRDMCSLDIAKELEINEQNIYYHMNILDSAGLIELKERQQVRGAVAKVFGVGSRSFTFTLGSRWRPGDEILKKDMPKRTKDFFSPFIKDSVLDSKIVVGSPDPHGPYKARSRDGHYAIELGIYLGNYCKLNTEFSTMLDVDTDMRKEENLIVVGGPVTNLIMSKINDDLPVKFSESPPWGIKGREIYTDENIGMIARFKHPHSKEKAIIAIAGIRFSGTKAAVLAMTRHTDLVLNRYTGQKEYFCIVQGFDLDGDGKIDSIEIIE